MTRLQRLARAALPSAGDPRTLLLAFAYAFGTAASYLMHRSAANSLFLVHVGVEKLPLMYLGSAALVVAGSFLYGWAVRRFSLDVIMRTSLLLSAGSVLALRTACVGDDLPPAAVAALVLVNELRGTLNTIQFSTLVNDLFAEDDPKQIFGFVGAGSTLAGVLFGTILGVFVDDLGTSNLLYLIAAIDLATLIPVVLIARSPKRRRALQNFRAPRAGSIARRPLAGLRVAARSPLARSVAILVFVSVCVNMVVEFQWQLAATTAFAGDADAITAFFGTYYASVYVVVGLLQLTLSGWYLKKFGVLVGLLTQPTALAAALFVDVLAIGKAAVLWAATLAKGCEVFKRTVNDPVLQIVYWPLDGVSRRQAIAFTSGVVKPTAEAFGALLLLEVRQFLAGPQIVYAALALAAAWAAAAVQCRLHYVRALNEALRAGHYDLGGGGRTLSAATVQHLQSVVDGSNPGRIVHALEILGSFPQAEDALRTEPIALVQLHHFAAEVREAVLDFLAASGDARYAPHVRNLFFDRDVEVRVAAVRAYCRLLGEASLEAVGPLLDDPAPAVVAATLTSLNRWAGSAAAPLLNSELEALAQGDATLRTAAVQVLASSGERGSIDLWRRLFRDPDPRVQVAAVRAAGRVLLPALVPLLVDKLRSPGTAAAAAPALAGYGDEVVPQLVAVLKDPRGEAPWRQEVVRVLRLIPTATSLDALLPTLGDEDEDVAGEGLRAVYRLVRDEGLPINPKRIGRIERACRREAAQFHQRLAALEDLDGAAGADLLRQALEERLDKSVERALLSLAILQPSWDFPSVAFGLRSKNSRGRILSRELLFNTLAGDLAPCVLAMVSDLPRTEVLRVGNAYFHLDRGTPTQVLKRLVFDRNDWIKTTAIALIGELGWKKLVPEVEAALGDQAFVVRETALLVLTRLLDKARLRPLAEAMLADVDPRIAARARSILAD